MKRKSKIDPGFNGSSRATAGRINCFIPFSHPGIWDETLVELRAGGLVNRIYLMGREAPPRLPGGCGYLKTDGRFSTATIKQVAGHSAGVEFTLLVTGEMKISLGTGALERFIRVAEDTGAGMVYSDYFELSGGTRSAHPVIDYQAGSIRDDFEFGPLLMLSSGDLMAAAEVITESFSFAGLYQLRLKMSQAGLPVRIQEYLYTVQPADTRATGKKLFDYLDPGNRDVQIEMEKAATLHLKEIGAFLNPEFDPISFDGEPFKVEASVIVPVLNRVKTIADAIESAMAQRTTFDYNLIVVDNHSWDGTTEVVEQLAGKYSNLIHIIPQRKDLLIGGCWNVGIRHPECGRFSIQLDSDDLYSDENTLEQMVRAFYQQHCAMVIGSYRLTNFELEEVPPGIVDHREWTPENGRNNALRINGLGAPRAFYTPVLRRINLPNVSYGEDYGAGLAVSRHYRIGRIYAPLYLCRRWEDNSDASLPVEDLNRNNQYKDRIRTYELMARIKLNRKRR